MGQWVERDGVRAYITDDGQITSGERPGLFIQAQRQVRDIGSGIKETYGTLTNNPDLVAQAQAETAERSAIFEGPDEAYPVESMVGQAIPGILTAPFGGLKTGIALGALESALDTSEPGNWAQRGAAGGLGAILGDMGGRILGRVWNAAEGLSQAIAGRRLAANTQAEAFEKLGGETLAYQRMTPDTLGQSFAERATQGAQASVWGAPQVKAAFNANEALFNQTAADAVGTQLPSSGLLDDVWRKAAEDRFQLGFAEVASIAQRQGDIQLAGPMRSTLNQLAPIEKLKKFGLFTGLDRKGDAVMTGKEWKIARQALADEAAQEANSEVQGRLYGLIDELDTVMERKLGEQGKEFTDMFGRLREQYRTYLQLEKPNVINKEGNINVAALNRNLKSRQGGFGRTATSNAKEVYPETQNLLDLARAADKPGFAAFKSSGTAENLALRDLGRDVQGAVTEGAPGIMGLMMNQAAPLVTPMMEAGGGLPYEYLLNRAAPGVAVGAGAGVGRGMLDEAFYPFVGADDERAP